MIATPPTITPPQGCWVIDRKITIGAVIAMVGIMLAMAVHTITLTRWLSQMESRIAHADETIKQHHDRISAVEVAKQDIAVMKNDVAWIRETLATAKKGRQ